VTATGRIVIFELGQFIVDADDQPKGCPLRDVTPFASTDDLADQRQHHAPAATPRYAEDGMAALDWFTDFVNLSSPGGGCSVSHAPS
jgi:hypothetical protein